MQDVSEHLFYRTPLDDCFYFTIVAGFIVCNYILLVTFKKWEVISRLKNSSIYLKDFEDFDLFFFTFFFVFSFSLRNACLPCQLRKAYAVLCCLRFVGSETPRQNDFEQFWKFEFHLERFPRNTRVIDFDGPSDYLYLFKNHRQAFPRPGERPSSLLKDTKMWFGPNVKYLLKPFFEDFCYREGISCLIYPLCRLNH